MSECDVLCVCPACGAEAWQSYEELQHYSIGCSCGGTYEETGDMRYTNEWAHEQNSSGSAS